MQKNTMKISPNGQITIPPDIQEKLGLLPGTEIQLEVIGDILQIRKPTTLSRGKQLIAAIRGKATSRLTTNDIMQATRDTKSGY
jgi:AbrB family looped-hinge helix DNA binding protein